MGAVQVLIGFLILGCLTSFVTLSPIKGGRDGSSSRPSNFFRVKGNGQTRVEQPSWVKQPTAIRQDDQTTASIATTDHEWSQRDQQTSAISQEVFQQHDAVVDQHDSQQQSHDQTRDSFGSQSGHHDLQTFQATEAPLTTTVSPSVTFTTQSLPSSFGARIPQVGGGSQPSKCSAKGNCQTKLNAKPSSVKSAKAPEDFVRASVQSTTVSSFEENTGLRPLQQEEKGSFGQQPIHSMFPGPPRDTFQAPDRYDVPQENVQFSGSDDYETSFGQSQGDSGHVEGLLHPDHDPQPHFVSQTKGKAGFAQAQQPVQSKSSQQQNVGFQQPMQDEVNHQRVKGGNTKQSVQRAGIQQPAQFVSSPQSVQDVDVQQQTVFEDQSRIPSSGASAQHSFDHQAPVPQTQTDFQSSSQFSGSSTGQDFGTSGTQGQSFESHGSSGASSHDDGQYQEDGQFYDDGQYQYYANPLDGLRYNVPGSPGEDYPILYQVPDTSFSCQQQAFSAGIYGDMEASCQVFHVCKEDGGQDSFLCPNGTVFNQQYFVCDWWYNYRCADTPSFYSLNAELYWDFDRFMPSQVLNVPLNNNEQSFPGPQGDVGAVDSVSSSGHSTAVQVSKTSQHDRNSNHFEQRQDGQSFTADTTTGNNFQSTSFEYQQQQVFVDSQPQRNSAHSSAPTKISTVDRKSVVSPVNQVSFQPTSSDSRNNQQPDSNAGTRYPGQSQDEQNADVFQQHSIPQTSFGSNPSSVVDRSDAQQLLSVPFVDEMPNTFADSKEPDEVEFGQRDKNAAPFGFNQQTSSEIAGTDTQVQQNVQDISKKFEGQNEFFSEENFETRSSGSHSADFNVQAITASGNEQFADQEHISVPFGDQVRNTDDQGLPQTPVEEHQQQILPFDTLSNDHQKPISDDSQFPQQSQESLDDTLQNFSGNEGVREDQDHQKTSGSAANDSPLDNNHFLQQEFLSNTFEGQTTISENANTFPGFDANTAGMPGVQQGGHENPIFQAPIQTSKDGDRTSNELDAQNVQRELINPEISQEFVSTDFDSFTQQHGGSANSQGQVPVSGFPDSQEQIARDNNQQTNDRHPVQSQIPFNDNQQDILRNVNQNNEDPTLKQTRHPEGHHEDARNAHQGQNINQERIPANFNDRQLNDKRPDHFVQGDNRVWQQVQQQRQPTSFNEFPAENQGFHQNNNAATGDRPHQEQFQVPGVHTSNQGGKRPQHQPTNFRPYGQNPQQNPNHFQAENQGQYVEPDDQQRKISVFLNNEGPSNRNFFVTNGHQVRDERPQQGNADQRRNYIAQEQPRPYADQGPYQQEQRFNQRPHQQEQHFNQRPHQQEQHFNQRPQQLVYEQPQQFATLLDQGPTYQNQEQHQIHQGQYAGQRPVDQPQDRPRYVSQSQEEYVPETVIFPGEQGKVRSNTLYNAQGRSLYMKADEVHQGYSSPEQAAAARSYNGWKPIGKY